MSHYKQNEEVVIRKVDQEIVLMDISTGKYFCLNQTGAIIWESIVLKIDSDNIPIQLTEKFSVSLNDATQDTNDLIKVLLHKGLILEDLQCG